MGDFDQALARAAARRVASGGGELAKVPPAPHFPVEPQGPSGSPGDDQVAPSGPIAPSFEWPGTVRVLEQEHAHRFERLADALVAARDASRVRSLFFTSCHRAEGRTTLVLGLARALARRPGRAVIVDADLAGPMLARSLGLRPRVGFDDVLEGSAPLAEAVIESPDDHLWVLPLRGPVSRPREAMASAAWASTLARLRRDFDHVLVDGGPLFAGLNPATLPHAVDAAILVRNRAMTGDAALGRAQDALLAGGIPLLGLAETFA